MEVNNMEMTVFLLTVHLQFGPMAEFMFNFCLIDSKQVGNRNPASWSIIRAESGSFEDLHLKL